MNTKNLISVVVPVYNVEAFIEECVRSIIAQTYENWECVLIDDGSSDQSGRLCDMLAQQDPRITVIHQSNRGVTYARFQGVKQAKGDFITFVDSDDTLPNNALELLIAYSSDNTDIILGKINKLSYTDRELITVNEYRLRCLTGKKMILAPFAKLFRRSLFSEHVFSIPREIVIGEDYLMNLRIAFNASNMILFINEKVYCYRSGRTGSATTDFNSTLSYQKLMFDEMVRSIPISHMSCYKSMIVHNMIKIFIRYLQSLSQITEADYAYGRYLITEADNTCIQLSIVEKMLLKGQGFFIRKMLLLIFDCVHKFKNKLNV